MCAENAVCLKASRTAKEALQSIDVQPFSANDSFVLGKRGEVSFHKIAMLRRKKKYKKQNAKRRLQY